MNKQLKSDIAFCVVFAVIALFIAIVWKKCNSIYPETGIVTNIEKQNDLYIVEFTLSNGNTFVYECSDGDVFVGDYYSILFDNRNTDTVKDDRILKIKYCGF